MEEIDETPSIRAMLKPVLSSTKEKRSEKESKLSWRAHIFKSKLQEIVGRNPEKKCIIIHAIPEIMDLQTQINNTVKNPNEENRNKIVKQAC